MILLTHTHTHTLIQLHIAYLFVGESKWVSLKIGARVYLKWKESPFMHNFCCFRSVVVVAGAALWQNENIRPTFYIINWQWVYVFVFMCVCTQLDSFRLDSTQLDWHMKAQSFRFRLRGIRTGMGRGMKGWGALGVGITRLPFPRGLKLIITFFTHNFILHWCVTRAGTFWWAYVDRTGEWPGESTGECTGKCTGESTGEYQAGSVSRAEALKRNYVYNLL